MNTTAIGRRAEQMAAQYLQQQGYRILAQNWRRRECEIDIVAAKAAAIYLVEVKYRATNTAGNGLERIDNRKLRRMAYAAERWVAENRWQGEYVLAAIEVSGRDYNVTNFIDTLY